MITIDTEAVQTEADRHLRTVPATITIEAVRSWWEIKADDPNDDPIVVMTAVPNGTLEVEILVPDGWSYMSPHRAKALAMVLLAAADEAETARVIS